MTDTKDSLHLRERVEEDRGLIKKIELAIPGFRGYRKREDLRIADSLLRTHLANKIKNIVNTVEECRDLLTKKMELTVLEDAGRLVNRITVVENRVRHAEQGYTGISADHRIDIPELNNLYEWDLELIDDINELNSVATKLKSAIDAGSDYSAMMKNLDGKINDFNQLFDKRIKIIGKVDINDKIR
jgi:hypothetical protein